MAIGSDYAASLRDCSRCPDGWSAVEQRKVLLIIISVTIVLAAIIGVGIWLFYPRDVAQPESLARADGGLEWEPLDYLRGDGELPDMSPDEPEDDEAEFVVTYGVAESDEPSASGRVASGRVADDAFVAREPESGEGDAATPTADREVPDGAPGDEVEPEERAIAAPTGVATDGAAAARPTSEPARPATRPAPAEAAPGPSTPDASAELADRAYWVQAISSPNRDTIEQAQRTLREHQLGTRILTREIDGTTYFRLRLGPFAVRAEAEKFLGWVVEIDGFEDAMIFVDYTTVVLAAGAR